MCRPLRFYRSIPLPSQAIGSTTFTETQSVGEVLLTPHFTEKKTEASVTPLTTHESNGHPHTL